MKRLIVVSIVILLAFLTVHLYMEKITYQFVFSFPLQTQSQDIQLKLQKGRYEVVLNPEEVGAQCHLKVKVDEEIKHDAKFLAPCYFSAGIDKKLSDVTITIEFEEKTSVPVFLKFKRSW